jgi:hypothetical protein
MDTSFFAPWSRRKAEELAMLDDDRRVGLVREDWLIDRPRG